jgi:protein SCO1/2/putative membrane protein
VTRSYRLGVRIVLGAIIVAAAVSLSMAAFRPATHRRAGQDLPPGAFPLADFHLVERSGRAVTQADLKGRVWVASFIFTRCPLSCPRITSVMKDLERRLAGTRVMLVSISVDPEHDTPSVLSEYARKYNATPERWWFLTGDKVQIYELIQGGFKLGLQKASPAEKAAGSEAITHSDRLALVEDGQVIGFFESNDHASLDVLLERARRLALPRWVKILPTVNASLNGLCAFLLVLGWMLIRRRPTMGQSDLGPSATRSSSNRLFQSWVVLAHVIVMLTAVVISILFLTSYLVYHYQAGSTAFPHEGPLRVLYFTILLSHTALAIAVVPLVITTLVRALRGNYAKHAALAQVAFPIWLYVATTGVVIYLMLYLLPTQATSLQSII